MKTRIINNRFRLNSVEMKAIDSGNDGDSFNIIVNDNYTILSIDDSSIHLQFERTVGFEPIGLYNLAVKYDVIFDLEEAEDGIEYSSEYIKENISDIFISSPVSTYMSKLISDISSNVGALPIITPLNYQINN